MAEELKYIWDYVKLKEFSKRHDETGEVFHNLYYKTATGELEDRFPKWNGEMTRTLINKATATALILNEKVAEIFNFTETTLNELGFTFIEPEEIPPIPPIPPVPEFPKDITRAPYTIRVDNTEQEAQAKEFLGIDPPGDDLDTWLSKRDLAGLEQWKSYWTDIFTTVKMAYWIDFVNEKFEEYKAKLEIPPEPPPVITWWKKLLALIVDPILKPFLVSDVLFKEGYKYLTGKEMTDAEYELKKLQLADWVLPINVLLKLFTGKNLKGEAEEFGSAGDWIIAVVYLAAAIAPGPVDDVAARLAVKSITKAEAAKLTEQMGRKATIAALTRTVKAHPETSAKFLAKFPQPIREGVIGGLYRTADGRIAAVVLSKMGYFKLLRPWWQKTLVKAGATAAIALTLVGAIGSYPFAGFIKEESLQTLGFASETAKRNKDIEGLREALDHMAEVLDKTLWERFLGAIPYANILAQLHDFYDAAKIKMGIDEAGFEDLKKLWEEEAAPKGTLVVSPTPADAKVSVDKLPYIDSAFERIVELGTYHVLVSKWEHVSQDKYLEVTEDKITSWSPTLEKEITPPPLKAKLIISVSPGDAKIEVADHPEITTPGDYNVAPGSYTITFSKTDYQTLRRTVYLDEGETEIVAAILLAVEPVIPPEELKGKLIISITPEDALIEVAGEEEITAAGTYELTPGSYSIRASKEGFKTQIKTAFIKSEEEAAVSFILESIEPVPPVIEKATITITSSPIDSDVYIDGIYKWTTTPYTILLDEGAYFIRVQKDKYYPVEVEVEVEAGEVAELPFVLTKIPEPEIPPYPYIPQSYYYPTYVPDVPYEPDVVTTPFAEIPPYNYSNLYPEVFDIPAPAPISKPVEKELLINIETTDVKPWKGRIYSIAVLELSEPEAEPKILISNNEEELIRMFIDWFDAGNYAKLVGFKLTFDYRYIFAKMLLYRIQNKKFYSVGLRDVKQLLDQVKEEFVYYPDKTGTLDNWGKHLLGIGKYGSQELMLRKYISGDFDYVKEFQNRQIELTRDLYNLARFSMGEAFISSPSPVSEPISALETPVSSETPIQTQQTQCPTCFSYIDKTTGKCPICEPVI